ncbi:MAG: hypothetical protein ACJATQ_000816 [Cellvibrionaceae bacterium]|jgi:hypothetical protein
MFHVAFFLCFIWRYPNYIATFTVTIAPTMGINCDNCYAHLASNSNNRRNTGTPYEAYYRCY